MTDVEPSLYTVSVLYHYLRKIFQPTIEKVTGSRKNCIKRTVIIFLPANIISMIKRQMRWVTHVTCIGEIRIIN
jgi:hypothetical protein